MTTETGNRTQRHGGRRFTILLLVLGLAACGDAGDTADLSDEQTPAAADTAPTVTPPTVNRPAPRPPGDTVSITATLTEYSIEVSPDTIDSGSISLLLQNDRERPHTIEIRGDQAGRWVSLPIRPGGGVTMTMRIETGTYTVSSTDPAYVERGMRGEFRVR